MSSASTFGQNAWLVDEMFQQFQKDPKSVDKEWRELFEAQGGPNATPATTEAQPSAPKESAKPAPKAAPAAKAAPRVETKPAAKTAPKAKESSVPQQPKLPEPGQTPIRGIFKSIAKNMDISLEIPTATSVRDMPARLMFENRAMVNDQLKRTRGGKISFTHIIGYAMVKAVMAHPDMNNSYHRRQANPDRA